MRVVLNAADKAERGFTAEDLWRTVRGEGSKSSRSTVYRAIARLCTVGYFWEVWLPHNKRLMFHRNDRFVSVSECLECGLITCTGASDLQLKHLYAEDAQVAVHRKVRCWQHPPFGKFDNAGTVRRPTTLAPPSR